MLQAYRFALDPTPAQARVLASHCGAARKAFNEGLAQVKRCLDQREAERSYGVPDAQLTEVPWTLPALRRWWNASKDDDGAVVGGELQGGLQHRLDALARGLKAWSDSRSGKRRGPKAGFPRFKSRHRARVSCRFTTGAIRVDDRSHVVLPRIGRVKTHEPADGAAGQGQRGTARILAATVRWDGRRWYCSFTVETGRELGRPAHVAADRAHPVVGVDARGARPAGGRGPGRHRSRPGARAAALAGAQARLRAVQRSAARQDGPDRRTGGRGLEAVGADRGADRADPRPGRGLRRDALHKATTTLARGTR